MNEYIHMLKKQLHKILLLHVDSNSLLIYDKLNYVRLGCSKLRFKITQGYLTFYS